MGQGANLSSLWGAVIHGCVFYISKSDERKNESNSINAHNICLPAGRQACSQSPADRQPGYIKNESSLNSSAGVKR